MMELLFIALAAGTFVPLVGFVLARRQAAQLRKQARDWQAIVEEWEATYLEWRALAERWEHIAIDSQETARRAIEAGEVPRMDVIAAKRRGEL